MWKVKVEETKCFTALVKVYVKLLWGEKNAEIDSKG